MTGVVTESVGESAMHLDDVLLELVEPESTADGGAVEELWNVVHVTGRHERVFPYAKAFRLATDLAKDLGVDVYRRREARDQPELAESFRPADAQGPTDDRPRVGSVMTRKLHVISEDEPLRRARALMVDHGIRHLPVFRSDTLVGVITDRDLKRALDPGLGLPEGDQLFVRDVCVYETYQVAPGELLERVLTHMATAHIGSTLVVDHGKLVGIFTSSDACRVFAAHLRQTRRG